MTSRSPDREELPRLLDAFHIASQRLNVTPELVHNAVTGQAVERAYTKSRDAIESLFARLESENERLKETALTRYEAETVLYFLDRKPFKGPELDDRCDAGDKGIAKLRRSATSEETS